MFCNAEHSPSAAARTLFVKLHYPKPFHFELISALAYYTNLLGLGAKRIFQSVKPPFQTLAKFFFDIFQRSNFGMELFNVVTTSARATPPVITQPTSSADIVTTVSPGTHPARATRITPSAYTKSAVRWLALRGECALSISPNS
jgi:hypothetical protein